MSQPSKVNKENFRLLDFSSDEESEDLQLEIIPSRKKKITRRERSHNKAPPVKELSIGSEVQCALGWAVRGTMLLWLLMLTWMCAGLYDHVSTMSADVSLVTRSSSAVADELQTCHTTAKELQNKAHELDVRLQELEHSYLELVKRVEKASNESAAVANQLAAAPMLADTPRRLAELQRTVADIGSQISGFDGSISSARKQVVTAVTGVEEIRTLVHQLDGRTNETIANVTAIAHREDEMKSEITALNSTLTTKVDALQTRVQELSKPASTVAPTTQAPTPASTAALLNVTNPPVTVSPPGPPVKPPVLQ